MASTPQKWTDPLNFFLNKKFRCASDLDDGMKGFWKLIGPLSCNGIWKRYRVSQKKWNFRDLTLIQEGGGCIEAKMD